MISLFLIHLGATCFLTGLIWVIQLVHYPSFLFVQPERFEAFHAFHVRNIMIIVAPLMLVEFLTGASLLLFNTPHISQPLLFINFFGLLATWTITAFMAVPAHKKLEHSFDERIHKALLRTNWVRTTLWSTRMLLLLVAVKTLFSKGAVL